MIRLKYGNRYLASDDVLKSLRRYRLLPSLFREIVIEEAIAPFKCDRDEIFEHARHVFSQQGITEETERPWLKAQGFQSRDHFLSWIERTIRVEKFKEQTWGAKIGSYFLMTKHQRDQVIYSFVRVQDEGLATELYCRLLEEESEFSRVARDYSQGFESKTYGIAGPHPIPDCPPVIQNVLVSSIPGKICPPLSLQTQMGDTIVNWWVIVRLEEIIPAQLDDAMRREILDELFNQWLNEQVNQRCQETGIYQAGQQSPPIPPTNADRPRLKASHIKSSPSQSGTPAKPLSLLPG